MKKINNNIVGEILVDEFEIDDLKQKYYKYEDKNILRDKLTKPEWKAFIFGEYNKNGFGFRKNFKIIGKVKGEFDSLENKELIYKDGRNRKMGIVHVKKVLDNSNNTYTLLVDAIGIYLENEIKTNILELFKSFNGKDLSLDEKNEYINGLFKINYLAVRELLKYFFFNEKHEVPEGKSSVDEKYEVPEGKFSALCSYNALKMVLEENNIIISQLDSFVKGHKLEYDAIVLNKNVDSNKRIYDINDVVATIEIKTSGLFNDDVSDITDYLESQKIEGKPHIYLAVHELDSQTGEKKYYTNTNKAIKDLGNEYISIFCKVHKDNEYIYIPENFVLKTLLYRIKK